MLAQAIVALARPQIQEEHKPGMRVSAVFFRVRPRPGRPSCSSTRVSPCTPRSPGPITSLQPVFAVWDRLFGRALLVGSCALVAGLCAEAAPPLRVAAAPECALGLLPVPVPVPVFTPPAVAPVPRRCRLVEPTRVGSATCSLRPDATRVPDGIAFQLRNWLNETPNRSAIVTSVSPRRTVYIRVRVEGSADGGTGTASASTLAILSPAVS